MGRRGPRRHPIARRPVVTARRPECRTGIAPLANVHVGMQSTATQPFKFTCGGTTQTADAIMGGYLDDCALGQIKANATVTTTTP